MERIGWQHSMFAAVGALMNQRRNACNLRVCLVIAPVHIRTFRRRRFMEV